MMSPEGNQEHTPETRSWLRRNFLSVLIFTAAGVLTVVLFFLRDKLSHLGDFSYLGAFLVALGANATIILPMPAIFLLFPLGAAFNPLYIGLAAGIGSAIGEMTSYAMGYSGRGIWKNNKTYQQAVAWLKKWGMFIVFVFAALPLPIDIMGLAGGNLRFPAWKYFVACWIGKTIKYIVIAYAGHFGYQAFLSSPAYQEAVAFLGIGIVAGVALLILGFLFERWSRGKHINSPRQ